MPVIVYERRNVILLAAFGVCQVVLQDGPPILLPESERWYSADYCTVHTGGSPAKTRYCH